MYTYITTPHLDTFDQALDPPGRGDPDRVGEDDLVRGQPVAEVGDTARIDTAFEGTAEGDADRDGRGQIGHAQDRLYLRQRLIQRHVAVSPVERLGRRERAVDASEPRSPEPLVALEVQDEPRVLRALTQVDRSGDLLRTRHLRHALVAHERRRLDPRQARGCEPVDELGADSRCEHVRLVLQPVPRPDVTDRYAHASTLTDPEKAGGAAKPCRSRAPRRS